MENERRLRENMEREMEEAKVKEEKCEEGEEGEEDKEDREGEKDREREREKLEGVRAIYEELFKKASGKVRNAPY